MHEIKNFYRKELIQDKSSNKKVTLSNDVAFKWIFSKKYAFKELFNAILGKELLTDDNFDFLEREQNTGNGIKDKVFDI